MKRIIWWRANSRNVVYVKALQTLSHWAVPNIISV
jgi:hypothetical protein